MNTQVHPLKKSENLNVWSKNGKLIYLKQLYIYLDKNQVPLFTSINLKPNFSKRFAIALMIVHNGALLILLVLTLPFDYSFSLVIKLCIGLLVVANAFYDVRYHLLFLKHPLYDCNVYHDEINNCTMVRLYSGKQAKIVSGSYSHPLLVVLRLKTIENSKVNTLIIFPDAIDTQIFRRLRVYLRYAS